MPNREPAPPPRHAPQKPRRAGIPRPRGQAGPSLQDRPAVPPASSRLTPHAGRLRVTPLDSQPSAAGLRRGATLEGRPLVGQHQSRLEPSRVREATPKAPFGFQFRTPRCRPCPAALRRACSGRSRGDIVRYEPEPGQRAQLDGQPDPVLGATTASRIDKPHVNRGQREEPDQLFPVDVREAPQPFQLVIREHTGRHPEPPPQPPTSRGRRAPHRRSQDKAQPGESLITPAPTPGWSYLLIHSTNPAIGTARSYRSGISVAFSAITTRTPDGGRSTPRPPS